MPVSRKQIVEAARTWIGCPVVHQARVKGIGIDCVGFIIHVGREVGIDLPDYKEWRRYSRNPLDEHGAMMIRHLKAQGFKPIQVALPGDVVAVYTRRFRPKPNHMMILTDVGVIHADTGIRKVVEHQIDDRIRDRITHSFSYPGVS